MALAEVLSILIDYDYDKLVPVYGFGAKVNHPNLALKMLSLIVSLSMVTKTTLIFTRFSKS